MPGRTSGSGSRSGPPTPVVARLTACGGFSRGAPAVPRGSSPAATASLACARSVALRCRQKRKFKATTNSNHSLPVAENLLDQQFSPTAPNQVWVTDITYIPTNEGWLYLAGLKDLFDCEIVGYAMGDRMTQELTARALCRAYEVDPSVKTAPHPK